VFKGSEGKKGAEDLKYLVERIKWENDKKLGGKQPRTPFLE